jgi:hypothetical protein
MFDLIACDCCGRSFLTEDAAAMLAAIKGPCPTCGGSFRLASPETGPPGAPAAAPRAGR